MPALLLFLLSAFLISCGQKPVETAVEVDPDFLKPFKPSPHVFDNTSNPITETKVKLGRMLYYEPRLSKSQQISCNSCHMLDRYGVDNQPTSEGHRKQRGNRNSPTTYHAAGHAIQFWDGRAPDVEEQAKGPMMNPVEMAMGSAAEVEAVLRSIPEYVDLFRAAFPQDKQPVTIDNAAKAIGAFERGLVTHSRFDKFLQGDKTALTDEEKRGLIAFHRAGCHSCHGGAQLGGMFYQKVGLVKPWPNQKDLGRYEVTKNDLHRMFFKVPSLRNIEKTGPYFHDGSAATLEESIRLMGDHQLERPLTDAEVRQITAFMRSLTGDIPQEYIRRPELPKSTQRTPKPSAD